MDLQSALEDAKKANSKGMGAVVNFLGEEIEDAALAEASVQEYLGLQLALANDKIDGFPSVKLTQLGLSAGEKEAEDRFERIASSADSLGQRLWVDMESSKFTDSTLRVYLESLERHRNVGVALQAYMRRSESDLKALLDRGAKVRLVKGAYREGGEVVFQTKREVSDNYSRLMGHLFERGDGFAIATHDSNLVEEAKRLAEAKHVDFRFEMLKGIRNDLKEKLVSSGYKVCEYLPYGDRWYAYSKRRITEHPSNVWLLLRSLF